MANTPKSAKLRLIQGSSGHRKVPVEPVVITPAEMKPPSYLSAAAKRIWRETAPALKASGMLGMQDRETLGRYCVLVAKIAEYEKLLATQGPVIQSKNGYQQPNSLIAIINSYSKQLVGLSDRFGMSPRSRQGQHVNLEPEMDEFEAYLNRGGKKGPV